MTHRATMTNMYLLVVYNYLFICEGFLLFLPVSPRCVYGEKDRAGRVRFFFPLWLCLSTQESILSALFPLCYSEPITWWGD